MPLRKFTRSHPALLAANRCTPGCLVTTVGHPYAGATAEPEGSEESDGFSEPRDLQTKPESCRKCKTSKNDLSSDSPQPGFPADGEAAGVRAELCGLDGPHDGRCDAEENPAPLQTKPESYRKRKTFKNDLSSDSPQPSFLADGEMAGVRALNCADWTGHTRGRAMPRRIRRLYERSRNLSENARLPKMRSESEAGCTGPSRRRDDYSTGAHTNQTQRMLSLRPERGTTPPCRVSRNSWSESGASGQFVRKSTRWVAESKYAVREMPDFRRRNLG
jgi:hypothetical protein